MMRAFLHKSLLTCYLSWKTRKEMQSRWTMELHIMISSILNSIRAQSSQTEIANSTELSNNSSRIRLYAEYGLPRRINSSWLDLIFLNEHSKDIQSLWKSFHQFTNAFCRVTFVFKGHHCQWLFHLQQLMHTATKSTVSLRLATTLRMNG